MALPQIDTHTRIAFSDSFAFQAQQMETKLRVTVMEDSIEGEKKFFDDFGKIDPIERTVRSQELSFRETPRQRRMIVPKKWETAELFEADIDNTRLMAAVVPNSNLQQAFLAGLNREIDRQILDALDGTAFSGKDGTTSVPFDTNQDVANSIGTGAGPNNLNFEKVLEAWDLLESVDAGGRKYFVAHPKQIKSMFQEPEATNNDFVVFRSLMSGQMGEFMGFNWISSSLIPNHSGDLRYSFAYTENAVIFGMRDMRIEVKEIDERDSMSLAAFTITATSRRFEDQVVRIESDDTAGPST